jgi:hypothetical protein
MKPTSNIKLISSLFAAIVLSTQITACVPVIAGCAAAGGEMSADFRTFCVFV